MPIDSISSNKAAQYLAQANKKTGGSDIDINDFFTLLSAQLQNQNMFDPTSDTEFVAQMAQFTTLQHMKDLVSSLNNTYAVSLIGKNVKVKTEDSLGFTTFVKGVVDKVTMQGGNTKLVIDGVSYGTDTVVEILSKEGDK